jgi:hypothetical protein
MFLVSNSLLLHDISDIIMFIISMYISHWNICIKVTLATLNVTINNVVLRVRMNTKNVKHMVFHVRKRYCIFIVYFWRCFYITLFPMSHCFITLNYYARHKCQQYHENQTHCETFMKTTPNINNDCAVSFAHMKHYVFHMLRVLTNTFYYIDYCGVEYYHCISHYFCIANQNVLCRWLITIWYIPYQNISDIKCFYYIRMFLMQKYISHKTVHNTLIYFMQFMQNNIFIYIIYLLSECFSCKNISHIKQFIISNVSRHWIVFSHQNVSYNNDSHIRIFLTSNCFQQQIVYYIK